MATTTTTTLVQFPAGQPRYNIPFEYLSRSFVNVSLLSLANPSSNRVLVVGDDFRFLNSVTLEILTDQTGFDLIQINRVTGVTPLVNFKDGSVLTAGDLTVAELQAIHISEEGRDQTTGLAKLYADQAIDAGMAAKGYLDRFIQLGINGYSPVGSFESGGTLTLENQVLRYGTGANTTHYRWEGILPKVVPAGSTPASTGDISKGAWVDVTDATLRSDLGTGPGAALIKYKSILSGSVNQALDDRLSQMVLVTDFGAKGDGVTNDAPAFQAAIDAAGWGGKVYIPKPKVDYVLNNAVYIRGPLTLEGWGGSTVSRRNMPCIRVASGVNGFVLQASLDGYRFDYGISGVNIHDLMIEGPDISVQGGNAICTDNSVNNGVFHVRECSFSRNHIRYMNSGFDIRGIVYLNEWYSNRVLWCYYGCVVDKVSGASEGASDQNRFIGNEFVLNQRALSLSAEGRHGSQTIVGNTLSEGKIGLLLGYNCQLHFAGNQIESNEWYGIGINIPAGANPASEASKLITGNCFLFNTVDIQIEKISTELSGGFPFSLRIESNSFQQTKFRVLGVTAPTGPQEFDSSLFYFASDNVYSRAADPDNEITSYTGPVPPDMIEHDWRGTRGYQVDNAITQMGHTSSQVLQWMGVINIPYGKQCYIKYNIRGMTANAASGTSTTAASIQFWKVGGGLIKSDFASSGELMLTREDVGSGFDLIWGGNVLPDQTGMFEVTYCKVG